MPALNVMLVPIWPATYRLPDESHAACAVDMVSDQAVPELDPTLVAWTTVPLLSTRTRKLTPALGPAHSGGQSPSGYEELDQEGHDSPEAALARHVFPKAIVGLSW